MDQPLRVAGWVLVIFVMSLAGCGGGESESASTGSGTSTATGTSAKSATDTNAKPAAPVKTSSQLAGSWFRTGDLSTDPLIGIEFSQDGQSITFVGVIAGNIQERTFPCTLLDGGRIRVTHPQFPTQTQVAVLKLSGSTLSLEPETQNNQIGMMAATFDRLSGKSITQRLHERIDEIVAEREALHKQIVTFVSQPNLIVQDKNSNAARIALDLTSEQGAVAYQRVGEMVVARSVHLAPARTPQGAPYALLQLGDVVGPPGAVNIQADRIAFNPTSGSAGGTLTLASDTADLHSDATLHAALKRDYEAIYQARRKVIDAFHEKIGHFLLIEAEPTAPRMIPEQLAFIRVDGEDVYRMATVRANVLLMPNNFTSGAEVALIGDAPQLRTNTHVIVPDPERPESGFIVSTRNGAQRYRTVERMTRDMFDARRAACAALVDSMKTQPLHLVGAFRQSERGYIRPARFTISSADGSSLTGRFHSDALALETEITGDIQESMLGLVLRVVIPRVSAHIVPGGVFDEDGTFTLDLQIEDGRPVATGSVRPGDSANRVTLAPPSNQVVSELRQKFLDHLKAGGRFGWGRTGTTGGSDEVMDLTLRADTADTVAGTVTFRRGQTAPVVGRLSEANGMLILDLDVQPNPAASQQVATGPIRLFIFPFEDSFHLSGIGEWNGQTRKRYVSYGPMAQ